jgi:hypothetical protein
MSLGVSGGKFLSQNTALRGSFSFVTFDGESLLNFGFASKRYFGKSFMLSPEINVFDVGGDLYLFGGANAGFLFRLANNIYIEPSVGYRYSITEDEGFFEIKAPFVLMF